jgi:hypothetical protein
MTGGGMADAIRRHTCHQMNSDPMASRLIPIPFLLMGGSIPPRGGPHKDERRPETRPPSVWMAP